MIEYIGMLSTDDKLQNDDDIIIYGFGNIGKKVYMQLKEKGLDGRIKYICDQNPLLEGKMMDNISIVKLDTLPEKKAHYVFLVCGSAVRDMCTRLIDGVNPEAKIHILRG